MDKESIESINDISFKVEPNYIKYYGEAYEFDYITYYENKSWSGCRKIINLDDKFVCDKSLLYYPYYYHCQELYEILPRIDCLFYVHMKKPFKILLDRMTSLYGSDETFNFYFIKCCILTHNYHEKNFDNMLDEMGTFIILPAFMLKDLMVDCEIALIEKFRNELNLYHLQKIEIKPFQIIFDKMKFNLQTMNFLDFYGLEIQHNTSFTSLKKYQYQKAKARKIKPFNLEYNSHEYVKVDSMKYYLNNYLQS